MQQNKSRLIIDGNAFYELDMDCVRCREKKNKISKSEHGFPEEKNGRTSFLHYGSGEALSHN